MFSLTRTHIKLATDFVIQFVHRRHARARFRRVLRLRFGFASLSTMFRMVRPPAIWGRKCAAMTSRLAEVPGTQYLSWRGRAAQQAVGAQIFVDLRPVDAVAAAGGLPLGALFRRGGEEAWIPGERDGDGAAVHQIDDQAVRVTADIGDAFIGDLDRNIHAMPPAAPICAPPPSPIWH